MEYVNYLLILELLSFEYVNCSLTLKLLLSTDVWYVNYSLILDLLSFMLSM